MKGAHMRTETSFWRRHVQKIGALLFWALLLGGYFWYAWRNQLSPLAVADRLVGTLRSGWGPLIYIAVYALRPLVLFSATVLTLAGGFVFGPVLGVIYTIIGANTSALVAYTIGRYFGSDMLEQGAGGGWRRYIERLRNNSFETVMIMRFIFLPYDLVNYLAGFLRIDWRAFLLATALGSLPGTISFVLLGSSFNGSSLTDAELSLNPLALGVSVAIFVLSIGLSRYFKRREAQREASAAAEQRSTAL